MRACTTFPALSTDTRGYIESLLFFSWLSSTCVCTAVCVCVCVYAAIRRTSCARARARLEPLAEGIDPRVARRYEKRTGAAGLAELGL